MRLRFLSIRHAAALSVTVLATESVIFGVGALPVHSGAGRSHAVDAGLPAGTHAFALLVGLALLALSPGLWRGTRTAVALSIAGLAGLATLNAVHGRVAATAIEAGLALMLALGRRAFRMGCTNRPRPWIAGAALAAWGLTAGAVLCTPLFAGAGHLIAHVLHHPAARATGHAVTYASGGWERMIDVLIVAAVGTSILALRSLVRPSPAANGHAEHEFRRARAILDAHGTDSLSPFLLRPDKALAFAAGGVLSYRVIGGTAVVSADPVAPSGAAAQVLSGFREQAGRHGWQVVLWGAGPEHLNAYAELGLRAMCVGEEAFVDPRTFSLEGRPVRKLRQSVHRVARRGWQVTACEGRDIGLGLEAEINAVADRWQREHPQVHGFAMSMGRFGGELHADDLYLLAHSPHGELGAVMRFVTCGESLSLDTMQRVGDTPNGLNEAMVAGALTAARERGIAEVSLNYAGLAHLVRREPSRNGIRGALTRAALAPLHRRFQMDRLVRFNEKFSPQWRPRYLVYESRAGLPRAIVRVLQAEGYLPEPATPGLSEGLRGLIPSVLPGRPRPRAPISDPR
ncbi:MAG: phosphatidylglycerol lysyltransferase domain-containing protein [Solirubrobacteraceae bacterium]